MIRLSAPDIGEEELQGIKSVLDSGWLVQGNMVREFEAKAADYLNVPFAVAVSSGTAALHLALLALGLGSGDEVVVPDFTFPATANTVEICGAKTVLCDIAMDTYCMDTNLLEKCITEKTRAILPVHEFGHSADMDPIMKLAEKYGLFVIEDAACAFGAEYKGRKAGTIGDIGCFSFHPRKAITTGEGGMAVTSDPVLAKKLRQLRNHGMAESETGKAFVSAGLNYRMTDLQGAMGIAQISKVEKIIRKRRELAEEYNQLLGGQEELTIPTCKPFCRHIYQTYHVLLNEYTDRDGLIRLLRQRGIETNMGAYALDRQPYYKEKYGLSGDGYGNADRAFERGLALPLHTGLCEKDIKTVASELLGMIRR